VDESHSEDEASNIVSVEPGDPHNDQMLAQTKEDLRNLLNVTVHPMIDQAEAQNGDLASMMAALCTHWSLNNAYMPRERLAALAALGMFIVASQERHVVADGKTERMPVDFDLS